MVASPNGVVSIFNVYAPNVMGRIKANFFTTITNIALKLPNLILGGDLNCIISTQGLTTTNTENHLATM